ncbi:hypothetical protein RB653_008551 [Dictyostelium firmibasis]|uniref:Protein RFT1 homolog n=1 Tax=Dictyostelium firmibasis TaxID=79012 RepID=A0AAN7U0A0_9MYCE
MKQQTESNVLKNGIVGAFYLIGLQIISRVFTFIINTLVIVGVDDSIFGVSAIQYQLLSSIILFLSREAIRRACTRVNITDKSNNGNNLKSVIKLSWLVLPIGIGLSVIFENFFLYTSTKETLQILNYHYGLRLFTISSILELLSEPMYILAQNLLLFKIRTTVEGFALFFKTFSSYYFIVILNMGLIGFGYAQILYSLTLVIGYFGYFLVNIINNKKNHKEFSNCFNSVNQLFPKFTTTIDKNLIKLSILYTWQSIYKLLLQEGEKFVLFFSETNQGQAIFAIVSNLGSLIVRFLFLPIEETCFLMFPKLFPTIKTDTTKNNNNEREINNENYKNGANVLIVIMKFLFLVSLIFTCFGPGFSHLLLNLLYKNKFKDTNAGVLLGFYCLYVGFLAVNGVSESFVHSVAKEDQLKVVNWVLIIIGFIYLLFTLIFCKLFQNIGIILANCLNMLLRIIYSIYFMKSFFKDIKDIKLSKMIPNKMVILSFIVSFIFTNLSNKYIYNPDSFKSTCIHLLVGIICFVQTCGFIYLKEWSSIKEFRKILSNKNK